MAKPMNNIHPFRNKAEQFKSHLTDLLLHSADVAGKPKPSPAVMNTWIEDLAEYPIDMITKAFQMHRKSDQAQFSPVPQIGMIVGHLEELKAIVAPHLVRPSAHTAWSIAKEAADETLTVVWNNEIAQAWYRIKSITDDRYHAPKAFMEEYERIVRANKLLCRDPVVEITLGSDPDRRQAAIENAVVGGFLSSEQATPYLVAPKSLEATLNPSLGHSKGIKCVANNGLDGGLSAAGQDALARMREYLSGPSLRARAILAQEERGVQARDYQNFLRQEQQRKFEEYQAQRSEAPSTEPPVGFPA